MEASEVSKPNQHQESTPIQRIPPGSRIGEEDFPLPSPPDELDLTNKEHIRYLLAHAKSNVHGQPLGEEEQTRAYKKIGAGNISTVSSAIVQYLIDNPYLPEYLSQAMDEGLTSTGYTRYGLDTYRHFKEVEDRAAHVVPPDISPGISTEEDVGAAIGDSGKRRQPHQTHEKRKQAKGDIR
jgi:hypothetical protein